MGHSVSTQPVVGSIAHWNAYEKAPWYAHGSNSVNGTITAGRYGHVGYVEVVYWDGSVKVSQYNMSGTHTYSVARVKAPRYVCIR